MKLVNTKLQVRHYAQLPCRAFAVNVKDEIEARKVELALANQHLFLYNEGIIGDYCNSICVVMWDENDEEWIDYWNEEEQMEWDEFAETYLVDIN